MLPRVRHGTQLIELDPINSELRVSGDAAAAILLRAALWLDGHRGFVITGMRSDAPPDPDNQADLTATMTVSLNRGHSTALEVRPAGVFRELFG